MKIAGSSMNLQGTRTYSEQTSTTEKLHYWSNTTDVSLEHTGVEVSISELAYKLSDDSTKQSQESQAAMTQTTAQTEVNTLEEPSWTLSDVDNLKISLIEKFIEMLTGKKLNLKVLDYRNFSDTKAAPMLHSNLLRNNQPIRIQSSPVWGLTYAANSSYKEEERTAFTASGLVKTADGQEISLSLNMTMSRQFTSTTGINLSAGTVLKDPLVINFDGNAAQLTKTNFQFDLDADGSADNMPFVQANSGFLALDKNGDNIINDGSELFGAKTGQGFSELAAYDEDHNNWIDENDAIFTKLKVWTKDEQGNDQLFTLQEKGVGAIYLGQAETQFALKDSNNTLKGEIKSTGIYLTEKGEARTIQQVDLSV